MITFLRMWFILAVFFLVVNAADDTVNCPSLSQHFEWTPTMRCENCRYIATAWAPHHHRVADDFHAFCETAFIHNANLRQKPRTSGRYWAPGKILGGRLVHTEVVSETTSPEPMSPLDNQEIGCYTFFLKRYCQQFGEKHGDDIDEGMLTSSGFCMSKGCRECDPMVLSKGKTADRVRWLKWMGKARPGKGGLNPYVPDEENENLHTKNPYSQGGALEEDNELLREL